MVRQFSSLILERRKSLVFEKIPMVWQSLFGPLATLVGAWHFDKLCRHIFCIVKCVTTCLRTRQNACTLLSVNWFGSDEGKSLKSQPLAPQAHQREEFSTLLKNSFISLSASLPLPEDAVFGVYPKYSYKFTTLLSHSLFHSADLRNQITRAF